MSAHTADDPADAHPLLAPLDLQAYAFGADGSALKARGIKGAIPEIDFARTYSSMEPFPVADGPADALREIRRGIILDWRLPEGATRIDTEEDAPFTPGRDPEASASLPNRWLVARILHGVRGEDGPEDQIQDDVKDVRLFLQASDYVNKSGRGTRVFSTFSDKPTPRERRIGAMRYPLTGRDAGRFPAASRIGRARLNLATLGGSEALMIERRHSGVMSFRDTRDAIVSDYKPAVGEKLVLSYQVIGWCSDLYEGDDPIYQRLFDVIGAENAEEALRNGLAWSLPARFIHAFDIEGASETALYYGSICGVDWDDTCDTVASQYPTPDDLDLSVSINSGEALESLWRRDEALQAAHPGVKRFLASGVSLNAFMKGRLPTLSTPSWQAKMLRDDRRDSFATGAAPNEWTLSPPNPGIDEDGRNKGLFWAQGRAATEGVLSPGDLTPEIRQKLNALNRLEVAHFGVAQEIAHMRALLADQIWKLNRLASDPTITVFPTGEPLDRSDYEHGLRDEVKRLLDRLGAPGDPASGTLEARLHEMARRVAAAKSDLQAGYEARFGASARFEDNLRAGHAFDAFHTTSALITLATKETRCVARPETDDALLMVAQAPAELEAIEIGGKVLSFHAILKEAGFDPDLARINAGKAALGPGHAQSRSLWRSLQYLNALMLIANPRLGRRLLNKLGVWLTEEAYQQFLDNLQAERRYIVDPAGQAKWSPRWQPGLIGLKTTTVQFPLSVEDDDTEPSGATGAPINGAWRFDGEDYETTTTPDRIFGRVYDMSVTLPTGSNPLEAAEHALATAIETSGHDAQSARAAARALTDRMCGAQRFTEAEAAMSLRSRELRFRPDVTNNGLLTPLMMTYELKGSLDAPERLDGAPLDEADRRHLRRLRSLIDICQTYTSLPGAGALLNLGGSQAIQTQRWLPDELIRHQDMTGYQTEIHGVRIIDRFGLATFIDKEGAHRGWFDTIDIAPSIAVGNASAFNAITGRHAAASGLFQQRPRLLQDAALQAHASRQDAQGLDQFDLPGTGAHYLRVNGGTDENHGALAGFVAWNRYNEEIQFFGPGGVTLGALAHGAGDAVDYVGLSEDAATLEKLRDKHPLLADMITGLQEAGARPAESFAALATLLSTASWRSSEGADGVDPIETVVGRAFALVKAGVGLRTSQPLYASPFRSAEIERQRHMQRGETLNPAGRAFACSPPSRIGFPIRLGGHNDRFDGLVGYFIGEAGATDVDFGAILTELAADEQPGGYVRQVRADDGTLPVLRANDPRRPLIVLMEPGRDFNLAVGILPETRLDLGEMDFADALARVRPVIAMGPMLGAVGVANGLEPDAGDGNLGDLRYLAMTLAPRFRGRASWLGPIDANAAFDPAKEFLIAAENEDTVSPTSLSGFVWGRIAIDRAQPGETGS